LRPGTLIAPTYRPASGLAGCATETVGTYSARSAYGAARAGATAEDATGAALTAAAADSGGAAAAAVTRNHGHPAGKTLGRQIFLTQLLGRWSGLALTLKGTLWGGFYWFNHLTAAISKPL